ncbi:MAG: GNAT family N-acetyltransferase [Chloroflexota bacterium]
MTNATIDVRAVSLAELAQLTPIPSGFRTDKVFRLSKRFSGRGLLWDLEEEVLGTPLHRQYDHGRPDEWLSSYADSPQEELRFLVAEAGENFLGSLTWRNLAWNDTLLLVDIRVRENSRRGGVGSALLGRLLEEVRTLRVRGIMVETQIDNYAAICFYRRQGFEIAGFNDHLYSNDDLDRQSVALYLFRPA